MNLLFTRQRPRRAILIAAALLMLGFFCQLLALDRFVDPVEAAGSPVHAGTEFCHGSLSNCAGTVDIGSSLHATLAPPVAPDSRPDALETAVVIPAGQTPAISSPPPQAT